MQKELTKRSVVFSLIAVLWIGIVSIAMFGTPVRVRAEVELVCPSNTSSCYYFYCHPNYDAGGNVLSNTCNARSYTGTGSCSEQDCVEKKDEFID